MNRAQLNVLAQKTGYAIMNNRKSVLSGRTHKYCVCPSEDSTGGCVTYHDNLTGVQERLVWADTVQGWQRE